MGILKWVLGVGAVGAATEYGIAAYFFNRTLIRGNAKQDRTIKMAGTNWDLHVPRIRECREWMNARPSEAWSITSRDALKLEGLFIPADGAKRTVICFHGYTSEGTNDFPCLAKYYLESNYNVLMVDLRAHGKSEGTYIGFGCLDRWDALAWIREVVKRLGEDQEIILHGISMGGATVLMTSGLKLPPQVKGIIGDCAFTSAWDVFTSVLHNMYHIPAFPIMQIADKMARDKAGYGLAECNAAEEVKKATVPFLLIHGDADTFVPSRMCGEIYENCATEAEMLMIKGASHAEAYHVDTPAYENAVTLFLNKVTE